MTLSKAAGRTLRLSRWQLDLYVKCPRCFWLLKRHGIKQPEGYPLALNTAMDTLLKAEFDEHRARSQPHPILTDHGVAANLFPDLAKLQEWRNNFQGLRWAEPHTGHVLYGAIDDVLEFPDGSLAVLDYKSSGARDAAIYPSYQLQMDVYTFLLRQLGYRIAPKAYFAFFIAVREDGFRGRLPFRSVLVAVEPHPERVLELFHQAIAAAQSSRLPDSGTECDCCRWFKEAGSTLSRSAGTLDSSAAAGGLALSPHEHD